MRAKVARRLRKSVAFVIVGASKLTIRKLRSVSTPWGEPVKTLGVLWTPDDAYQEARHAARFVFAAKALEGISAAY